MWFDSWSDVLRVILVGAAAYISLIVVLRITGRRTLSQLNAFDFIVTVAFGSTLATIVLSADTAWAEGAAALALLAALQWLVASIAAAWPAARRVITSAPKVVVRDGLLRHDVMRASRLNEADVMQAIRSSGSADLSGVAAVVLETNGKLSVIGRSSVGDGRALSALLSDDDRGRRRGRR